VLSTEKHTNHLLPSRFFPFYGNGLDLPANRTVQLDLESANLGECEPTRSASLRALQRPTQLRVGETIVAVKSLETRKARLLLTFHTQVESLERLISQDSSAVTSDEQGWITGRPQAYEIWIQS
jgi:hypothetical protein